MIALRLPLCLFVCLFSCIGRIVGIAIRTKVLLSLSFPTLFWQLLSGREPTRAALREIDQTLVDSIILPIEACQSEEEFMKKFAHADSQDESEMSQIDVNSTSLSSSSSSSISSCVTSVLHFPVTRSDGTVPLQLNNRILTHGHRTIPVTWPSSKLYAQQLEETRLYECIQQIQAIRRGMSDIIPPQVLCLFSPSELALLTCGRNEIDIAMLRRHTEYSSGLSDSTPHIQWFWDILDKEFDQKQKQKFIKFTYAQERLPASDAEWQKIRMLIKPSAVTSQHQDHVLPHAETCFFNLRTNNMKHSPARRGERGCHHQHKGRIDGFMLTIETSLMIAFLFLFSRTSCLLLV